MTKLKFSLALGFLLIGYTNYAQDLVLNLHKTSLKECLELERKLNSEPLPNIRNHISTNGIAQPIKFKRKQDIISDLVVYYFFKEKDSILTSVLYEWDESLLTLKPKTKDQKSIEYQKALIQKYKDLEGEITRVYGKPKSKGALTDLSLANKKEGLRKKSEWYPNDSTEIEMYTTISNYYEKKGMVTIAPTHRIRLYVRNIKKVNQATRKPLKLDSLNTLARNFFKAVHNGAIRASREFLSPQIQSMVSDEQLNLLGENISLDKEIELIWHGNQMNTKGEASTLLHYKYQEDTANPPKEMIRVIFDEKSKIIGVHPISLTEEIN